MKEYVEMINSIQSLVWPITGSISFDSNYISERNDINLRFSEENGTSSLSNPVVSENSGVEDNYFGQLQELRSDYRYMFLSSNFLRILRKCVQVGISITGSGIIVALLEDRNYRLSTSKLEQCASILESHTTILKELNFYRDFVDRLQVEIAYAGREIDAFDFDHGILDYLIKLMSQDQHEMLHALRRHDIDLATSIVVSSILTKSIYRLERTQIELIQPKAPHFEELLNVLDKLNLLSQFVNSLRDLNAPQTLLSIFDPPQVTWVGAPNLTPRPKPSPDLAPNIAPKPEAAPAPKYVPNPSPQPGAAPTPRIGRILWIGFNGNFDHNNSDYYLCKHK